MFKEIVKIKSSTVCDTCVGPSNIFGCRLPYLKMCSTYLTKEKVFYVVVIGKKYNLTYATAKINTLKGPSSRLT